eukprot:COSAG01_NODE_27249_length_690_cov_1.653130_1_plen_229_part_11
MDKRVTVAELARVIDDREQPAYDAQMDEIADEMRLYSELFRPEERGSVTEKTEIFNHSRLEQLNEKVTSDPVGFERYLEDKLDPKTGLVKTKAEQVKSMIGDMVKLLAIRPNSDGYGEIRVSYHYIYGEFGRRYCDGRQACFQNIQGGVRKTIAEGLYWDLDFENCFPVILYHTCKHYDQPTPVLERIVKDREKLLSEIMAFFSCTRKAAKQLVLKHIHGGRINGKWFN